MGQPMLANAGDSSRTHGPADVSLDMFFQSCIQSNLVQMSAHSQTPPESVGPLPPDRIPRAISSGCLHVMRSGHVFPLSLYSTSFPLHATPLTHIAYGLLTDL